MSDFRTVNDKITISPQLSTKCIDNAAEIGVTLIINNRPDGEENGQPTNQELSDYAKSKGINWTAIPVKSGQFEFDAIRSMSEALRGGANTLAFCRSGTRSCTLWGLAEAFGNGADNAEILDRAMQAGYDLAGTIPTLKHLRGEH